MKLVLLFFLLLPPFICSAQLFPDVADFKGNIMKVVEKKYGKEIALAKKDTGIFKSGKFSGLKDTYFFGANSNVVRLVKTLNGKIYAEHTFQRTKKNNGTIEREIIRTIGKGGGRTCVEYENITNSSGQITQSNQWSVDLKTNKRELLLEEKDAEYRQGKLQSFVRRNVNEKGEPDSGEKCKITYDSAGHITQIERTDLATNLKTTLDYSYNQRGSLDHYSVDLLIGLPVYGTNPRQEVCFKCDKKGNWIKKYRYSGGKKILEAKRTIKYKK